MVAKVTMHMSSVKDLSYFVELSNVLTEALKLNGGGGGMDHGRKFP